MPEVDWTTNTTFKVSAIKVGTFTSYTTGANGTTRVIPTMTASTVALTTGTTVGVTAVGWITTASFTSQVNHINKLTDDVAALYRIVTAIVSDLKTTA